MRRPRPLLLVAPLLLAPLLLAACGGGPGAGSAAGDGEPVVVATTTLLADVARGVVGDLAHVEAVMPRGADAHTFSPSPSHIALMREADVLVVNGGGLEEALLDAVEAAEDDGVVVHEMLAGVPDPLPAGDAASEAGDRAADADGDDGHDDHGDLDPHFFTDARRTAAAGAALVDVLAEVDGIDAEALRASAEGYLAEVLAADEEAEAVLATVPEADRVLVTDHDAFSYFADRYGFRLIGSVIPSTSTQAAAGAAQLQALVEAVRAAGVPAVFAEATTAGSLVDTLAAEVGDVEVATLHSESLGPPGSGADTYLGYVRANARTVAGALGGTVS